MAMDEFQLIELAKKGASSAVEQLLETHYDLIFSVCVKITGNTHDANEATQEALISIVRGISSFRSSAKFSTWVYRIATNAALDEIRRRSRRPTDEYTENVAAYKSTPDLEESVIQNIDLDAALQNLPEDFRTIVILRDVVGSSYEDISDMLGIPSGTVKSRIARARQKLKEDLVGNKTDLHVVKEVNDG